MYQLRCTVLVDAPQRVVFDHARDIGFHRALDLRVVASDPPDRIFAEGRRWPWRSMRSTQYVVQTAAGTLVTTELEWTSPGGRSGRRIDELVLRAVFIRLLRARHAELTNVSEYRPYAVGAAIIDDDGRVLAAQRNGPPALAGKWEFPGGKLHGGETEIDALIRECHEELDVLITPSRYLGEVPILDGTRRLRVWVARIVTGSPAPLQHRQLRWVSAAEVDSLDWLPADRPLLDILRPILEVGASARRAAGDVPADQP